MVGKQEVEIASALPSLGRSAVGRLGELAYYRRHANFLILIGGTSGPETPIARPIDAAHGEPEEFLARS
jgi:hypothetical protein